jgi:hypothetical protein
VITKTRIVIPFVPQSMIMFHGEYYVQDCEFEVLTVVSMKMAVFGVVVLCVMAEVPGDGGKKYLWDSVKLLPDCMVL